MSSIFNLPPMLRGSEKQQIDAIRSYLVQMANELTRLGTDVETLAAAGAGGSLPAGNELVGRYGGGTKASAAPEADAELMQANVKNLKSLISSTADTVRSYADSLVSSLSSVYVAQSEFGELTENISSEIEQTARGTVEAFGYQSQIDALNAQADEATRAVQSINGEIRRGIITDPSTGEEVLGIAVAEQLSFTGERRTVGGTEYYELSPGQTLGLYTATGWQFWVNGSKRGWFSSADGMLHLTKLIVEESFQLAGSWLVSSSNGYGIRWVG